MSGEINWGPEIAVDGKRPAWLKDNVYCTVMEGARWHGEDGLMIASDCRAFHWLQQGFWNGLGRSLASRLVKGIFG